MKKYFDTKTLFANAIKEWKPKIKEAKKSEIYFYDEMIKEGEHKIVRLGLTQGKTYGQIFIALIVGRQFFYDEGNKDSYTVMAIDYHSKDLLNGIAKFTANKMRNALVKLEALIEKEVIVSEFEAVIKKHI